jgi:methyl-accepting chemotaxis protein
MKQRDPHSRDIRSAFLIMIGIAVVFAISIWMTLVYMLGPVLIPLRGVIAGLLLLMLTAQFLVAWRCWEKVRRGSVRIAASDRVNSDEISRMKVARTVLQNDFKNATPYIEIMCEQIRGSLADSEHEVIAMIEQMDLINAQSLQQSERISQSIHSGTDLTETTQLVEHNKQVITTLEAQLQNQVDALQHSFDRIQVIANEVNSLAPMTQVITSIAKQTGLLALNAEIQAAGAGESGRGFAVVADEVRGLSKQVASAAADIASKISTTADRVTAEMNEAKSTLDSQHSLRDLQSLIADLAEMRKEFSSGIALLLDVLHGVKKAHQEIVDRLSRALGHVQFQDVMRQRLEQVQIALLEMREHMHELASKIADPNWDGQLDLSLKEILAGHFSQYKMASQVAAHQTVAGGSSDNDHDRPAIELF